MKRISIPLIISVLVSITSCGQVKNTSIQGKADVIDSKLLLGKWQFEDDAQYMLFFGKKKYSELNGKDTTDEMYYELSNSCNLKDSSSEVNLKSAYLVFYSDKDPIQECKEILGLKSEVLSWMDNKTGKIFVFKKIK